jgi:hypothetical protein
MSAIGTKRDLLSPILITTNRDIRKQSHSLSLPLGQVVETRKFGLNIEARGLCPALAVTRRFRTQHTRECECRNPVDPVRRQAHLARHQANVGHLRKRVAAMIRNGQPGTNDPRSTPLAFTPQPVASSPTVPITSTSSGGRLAMSIASSRARSQPSCRYRRLPKRTNLNFGVRCGGDVPLLALSGNVR